MHIEIKVPFVDPSRYFSRKLESFELKVRDIMRSGQVIAGEHTLIAEANLGGWFAAEAVLVGSCTEAISLALLSLSLKPGDIVVLPSYSFAATLNSVLLLGLKPLFVDVMPSGNGMQISELQKIIQTEEDIAAIIVAHLFGHAIEMEPIYDLCEMRGIALVEDCAQYFSVDIPTTQIKNHFFCYSFDPTKNFHSVERLGAVVTADRGAVEKLKLLRSHGIGLRGPAMNSRPSELAAAFLNLSWEDHEMRERKRQNIVNQYLRFCDLNGIEVVKPINRKSTWNKFVVKVDRPERFLNSEIQKKVQFRRHYDYILPDLIEKTSVQNFVNAQVLKQKSLTLPLFAELNQQEVDQTLDILLSELQK